MINYDKNSRRFQVDYQAPFGGLDSSAFASAINPANFAAISQAISDSNTLIPVGWKSVISQALASGNGHFLGYVPSTQASYLGYIVTTTSVLVLASDGNGGLTYTSYGPYAPAVQTYGHFSAITVDNLIIWTSETWNEIWSFNTTTNSISRLTNYVGGGYLGLIDDQLVNLGGVSNLDGTVPYRISWSAPGEYGQFQPYDVGSNTGSFAAGFNDLPDVSDRLVGMATIGTVAYLLRSQGVTQMNPTGNGVQPFSFNHLWASELGIGTVFPDSIAQYGSMCIFVADSGIYTLGLSGIREVSGVARKAIFQLVRGISTLATNTKLPQGVVSGVCVPYLLDTPSVYYVFGIATSVTSALSGTAPSVNTYSIFAIDLSDGFKCYSLGTQNVAPNSTIPATYAYGQLSFINRSFSSAPSPIPPTPPSYPNWANTTFYTPFNAWTLFLPNSNPNNQPYHTAGLYELTTAGTIYTGIGAPPTVNTPALNATVTVGTATFTYRGPYQWNSNTGYQVSQMCAVQVGTSPNIYSIAYKCTVAGTSGTSQAGWSQNPGDTIIDGTVTWVCVGPVSTTLTSENTPGQASSYFVANNTEILDVNNYLQLEQSTTVNNYTWSHGSGVYKITQYNSLPGGFSQTTAPTWNDTTGGVTNETKTLSTPVPAATWVCLGPKPSPPTSLVGANVAAIVPLFVSVNNDIAGSNSQLSANRLTAPATTDIGTVLFRKEQMQFGKIPTVTKVGFIANLVDATQPGTIQVSVDGGLSYNIFATVSLAAGNGAAKTVWSDGVQSLERHQLSVQLSNVAIAQAWVQGTLADEDII